MKRFASPWREQAHQEWEPMRDKRVRKQKPNPQFLRILLVNLFPV